MWNIKGKLLEPQFPLIMGIINATPDSFHSASRVKSIEPALEKARMMVNDGADILDIGGASSRPGAEQITESLELSRVIGLIKALRTEFPNTLISIDTWRAIVAEEAVNAGADMVNDISAGLLDPAMLSTAAALNVPYIAMHMQGTPDNMQVAPKYENVIDEVVLYLSQRIHAAEDAGIADIIVDPGFGFGKSVAHNYQLLDKLGAVANLGKPVCVGISRKSMVTRVLEVSAEEALNGTSILNSIAIQRGAGILRVHDVKQAHECKTLIQQLPSYSVPTTE